MRKIPGDLTLQEILKQIERLDPCEEAYDQYATLPRDMTGYEAWCGVPYADKLWCLSRILPDGGVAITRRIYKPYKDAAKLRDTKTRRSSEECNAAIAEIRTTLSGDSCEFAIAEAYAIRQEAYDQAWDEFHSSAHGNNDHFNQELSTTAIYRVLLKEVKKLSQEE